MSINFLSLRKARLSSVEPYIINPYSSHNFYLTIIKWNYLIILLLDDENKYRKMSILWLVFSPWFPADLSKKTIYEIPKNGQSHNLLGGSFQYVD